MSDVMDLGTYIRKKRKQRKLTQGEITQNLFDRSYWSQIETGARIPPIDTLDLIAERLRINVEDLKLLYPGSSYLNKFKRAVQSITTGLPPNEKHPHKYMKQIWDTFARIESTEHMIRTIEVWSKLPTTSYTLLESTITTIHVCTMEGRPIDDLWELMVISGNSYYRLGLFEQAFLTYRDILNKQPDQKIATRVHRNLGSTLGTLDHHTEALAHFNAILEDGDIDREMEAQAHHGISTCLRYLGDFEKSLYHCDIAHELYEPLDEFRCMQCLQTMGIVKLDRLEIAEAMDIFQTVETYYTEHNFIGSLAEIYEEYVRLHFYEHNYHLADEAATKCLNLISGSNPKLCGQVYIWKSWIYAKLFNKHGVIDAYYAAKSLLLEHYDAALKYMDPVYKSKWQKEVETLIQSHLAET